MNSCHSNITENGAYELLTMPITVLDKLLVRNCHHQMTIFFLSDLLSLNPSFSATTTSLTISWSLDNDTAEANSYTISYSNTNTDCFTDSDTISVAASETMYELIDLQEGTEYSITVTATLSNGGTVEDSLTASTMAAG